MVYVDSNVFLFALLEESEKGENAKKFFETALQTGQRMAASLICVDEVVWKVKKQHGKTKASQVGRELLANPSIDWIDLTPEVVKKSMDYVDQGLDPRDSIHAASCTLNGIRHIISDDADFDALQELQRIPLIQKKRN